MKKLFIIFSVILFSVGCSKKEDDYVNENFVKVLSAFNGTFADYQYSNLGGNDILPEPDMIVFGNQYKDGIEKTLDGRKEIVHGECIYKKYDDSYINVDCYYYLALDGSYVKLIEKATGKNYKFFQIIMKSETEFEFYVDRLDLPFKFKKQ